jgi:hypothetical protein
MPNSKLTTSKQGAFQGRRQNNTFSVTPAESVLPDGIKMRSECGSEFPQEWRTPDVCVGTKGCWCERPHAFNSERDEIEFASLPSLRILKEFIKRRGATFLEVLIRLQSATSSLLASVVDSDGSFCTFNHARRLNALMHMQNPFAGIKPYCDVCNPITQTMRLLTPETTRPVHIFLPTKIVATTVRKQDR